MPRVAARKSDEEPERRRRSGPSGKHQQAGVLVREAFAGQIDAWRAAAERAGMTLSDWIRAALDRAAKR
jgi:hypothetical protein